MSEPVPRESWLRRFLWPGMAVRKRLLAREAWFFLLASYPVIAFAYLWPEDFRNTRPAFVMVAWTAFLVRTFVFHAGLVYLAIAVFAAWVRNRRLLAMCAPLLVFSIGPTLLEYVPRRRAPIQGEALTVMSVNLLMVNRETDAMIMEIRAVAPDVLLLQEYTWHWHAALRAALGTDFPHCEYVSQEDSFGMAIYSRRPFVEAVTQELPLGDGDLPQMRAVIAVSGRPVAFYNIHLLPPRTLRYTTEHRLQTADLRDVLRAEQLPIVLSGDFNFTETSPQYSLLKGIGLCESHRLAGWGRGATWPVTGVFRYIPGLRFDRIFLSPALAATESRSGVGKGSDHRPVIAKIGFQ